MERSRRIEVWAIATYREVLRSYFLQMILKSAVDNKVSKGSKWDPDLTDLNLQGSVSEEVANDLTASKLAALEAAELVNENL